MNFTDLAKDYGYTRLEDLPELEQMEVVGAWLKEKRCSPDEIEPFVEALCDGIRVNMESEHALDFFQIMHDGILGEAELADWGYTLAKTLLAVYLPQVQEDLEKAQPAEDDSDVRYQELRDKRDGI